MSALAAALAGRPATKAGDLLTDKDGNPCKGVNLNFRAPYWIWIDGIATHCYGHDQTAAFEHFDRLAHARREALGLKPIYMM